MFYNFTLISIVYRFISFQCGTTVPLEWNGLNVNNVVCTRATVSVTSVSMKIVNQVVLARKGQWNITRSAFPPLNAHVITMEKHTRREIQLGKNVTTGEHFKRIPTLDFGPPFK